MACKDYFEYKPKKSSWKAYCAVDVGCITCGYAYSFKDADNIWINNNWADHLSYFAYRAPSAVLYDKDGDPMEFGYRACERYIEMTEETRQQVHFFYPGLLDQSDNFKKDHLDTFDGRKQCEELSDRVMNHRIMLSLSLGKHCKNEIEEKYTACKRVPEKFVWIFLVPMTWDIEQKSRLWRKTYEAFRTEFREQFQSNKYQIKVVNTTEALWLAVRDDAKKQLEKGMMSFAKSKHRKEKAVIIVHSGGTRTELSMHKKKTGRNSIANATLHTGGVHINQVFEQLLRESLKPNGDNIIQAFKSDFPAPWLEFLLKFESIKSAIYYNDHEDISISLYYSFAEALSQITGQQISDVLDSFPSKHRTVRTLGLSKHGHLILSGAMANQIYNDIISSIVRVIKKMMKNENVDVSGIILTGGFSESCYMREYFFNEQEQKNMEPVRLHTPPLSSMVMPMGAIIYVKSDAPRLDYSYAIEILKTIKKQDGVVLRFNKFFGVKVTGVFYAVLTMSQEIEVGKYFDFGPLPLDEAYKHSVQISIYAIEQSMSVTKDFADYYLSTEDRLKDGRRLNSMTLNIPAHGPTDHCQLRFRVIMDRYNFKTTMTLEAGTSRNETSKECDY